MTKPLERWLQFAIFALILLAPTQWGLEVRPKTYVSLADPLLAAATALLFLGAWRGSLAQRPSLPSPFALLFVALGAVSLTVAASRIDAAKDVVQWLLYFVGAWMLFRYILEDPRGRRTAFGLATAATIAVLAVALVQFVRTAVPDIDVGGTFGNRNVLAGFCALTLPFAFAQFLGGNGPVPRFAGLLVVLVGLAVTLSGAAVLGLGVAFLAMAAFRGRGALLGTVVVLLLVLTLVHPNLPRRAGHAESWPDAEEWRDPWIESIALHDASLELSRRYPEWEAAWLIASDHPCRGAGAGNYQHAVRDGLYRRIATRPGPPEPDTQNLYLVLAVSLGFPGLLAFVALLFEGMSVAVRSCAPATRLDAGERALALGAFGSLLAYALTAVWHPLLVRGIGVPLVGVLALAHHLHARAGRD